MDPRAFLQGLFRECVGAAMAAVCVPPNLPPSPHGRTIVIGAGKAAAAMAAAVEAHWAGPLSGLVVTRYGHGVPTMHIDVVEAGHPIPDSAGMDAARRMLALVGGLSENDLVLCLLSGGGSALLSLPASGLTLDDKRMVTDGLLKSGAPISAINCVRKHLSSLKGGRLALAAAPARVVSLIVSDVPGDDSSLVASGPTALDCTTSADALGVLAQYRVAVPPAARRWLESPASETPKSRDDFARVENRIIAASKDGLAAAARACERAGLRAIVLGDAIEGEARGLAREHARLALAQTGPCVLLSGGEATVHVKGTGRGGPNSEFLLALALALNGATGIWALACDTDGIDGSEDNAGAVIAPDTLARARALGLDARAHLANNDAYGFFAPLGDLVQTGPTRTNINDFRAILRL